MQANGSGIPGQKRRKNYPDAAEYYRKAVDLFKPLAEQYHTLQLRRHYATGCEKLASILKRLLPAEEITPLFETAAVERRTLAKDYTAPSIRHELAVALFNYGASVDSAEMIREALSIWEALSQSWPEYEKYREKAKKALTKLTK